MLQSVKHRAAISSLLRYLLDVTQLTIYFKCTKVLEARCKRISVAIILYVLHVTCCAQRLCETMIGLV